MMSFDNISGTLTATNASRFWLTFFLLSVLALCMVELFSCSSEATKVESLDAAGLELSTEMEATPNKVNTAQLPDSSFIYDVSIEELAKADSYLDGQTVQVTGEVVGDRIVAEDNPAFCWITLQSIEKSDSEVIVYMPASSADSIDIFGAYGKRGTYLQVRGLFKLACSDHQGSSEIHSQNVAVVSKGAVEHLAFNANSMIPGVLLLILGSGMMIVYNYLRERER